MSNISFSHLASAGKKISTEKIIDNVRKYYPDAYYFLGSDAADDLSEIAEKYNCDYYHYSVKVGYPSYDLEKILLWFDRFKTACSKCNTSHIVMMEDDVWIKRKITIDEDWELAGQKVFFDNRIPDYIIDSIIEFSGEIPNDRHYGFGGGAIFKVTTFLQNYDRILEWFKINHNNFQSQYGPLGYMDCYMMIYYLLCGKKTSVNPYLIDTHHHRNDGYDYDKFVLETETHIEIVNNYKKYYWI